jgi:DNA polymerase III subunit delta
MKNFILVTGTDQIAVKRKASEIADILKDEVDNEFSFEIINGESEKNNPISILEQLLTAINTPSFFSTKKTIWLKHFEAFESLKDKSSKNLKLLFDEVIKSLKENNDFNNITVLADGLNLNKKTPIYKFFASEGEVFEFNVLSSKDKDYKNKAHHIIEEYCKKEAVSISYQTVEFLIDTIGTDSGRLFSELDKLIAYVGNKKSIDIDDCNIICSRSIEMANWVFSDALANKQIKRAFSALNIISENAQASSRSANFELTILSSVINKFKEILQIKAMADILDIHGYISYQNFKNIVENAKNSPSLDRFSIVSWHPYRLFKIYEGSTKFKDNEIAEIFTLLLKSNVEFVSGNNFSRVILENLVTKICTKYQN